MDLSDQNSEKKAIDDLQDVEWMGREIRVNCLLYTSDAADE